jgi:hypothetical protein
MEEIPTAAAEGSDKKRRSSNIYIAPAILSRLLFV